MGPQRRMGIYVGFDSPTVLKYLEPTTGDLFKARYADCHFNESEHPTLGGDSNKLVKKRLHGIKHPYLGKILRLMNVI